MLLLTQVFSIMFLRISALDEESKQSDDVMDVVLTLVLVGLNAGVVIVFGWAIAKGAAKSRREAKRREQLRTRKVDAIAATHAANGVRSQRATACCAAHASGQALSAFWFGVPWPAFVPPARRNLERVTGRQQPAVGHDRRPQPALQPSCSRG